MIYGAGGQPARLERNEAKLAKLRPAMELEPVPQIEQVADRQAESANAQ